VDLPFERLDPRGLLEIHDRHGAQDALSRLRTARLALELDLRVEAALRFVQAAELDAALAGERDAGLAAIRAREAADAMLAVEERLRAGGDPRTVLTLTTALLEGPRREGLSAAQVRRVEVLAGLARRLVQRAQQQQAAAAAQPPAVAPVNLAVPPGLPADVAEGVAAEEARAREARDAAADPKVGARRALRHLEEAARALLAAKRTLHGVPAALADAAAPALERLRDLLVATYLDQADILRQVGRFDDARARVRAALILDPGNEDGLAQRKLIEDDLRRGPYDEYRPGVEIYDLRWHPGFGYVRTLPYGRGGYYGSHRPHRHVHGHGGFALGRRFGSGHVHVVRRGLGRRRIP
jgi:tetratricopeptide (TPR) repeat protein